MDDNVSPLQILLPFEAGAAAWRRASETLFEGCSEILAHQAEFFQVMVIDGAAELEQLTRVRDPGEFVQAAGALASERTDRVAAAWRNLADAAQRIAFNTLSQATEELRSAPPSQPARTPRAKAARV